MINEINPIVYLIVVTFATGLIFLNKSKSINKILFYILLNYFITELISIFLNINNISVGLLFNISITIQFTSWLFILSIVFKKQNLFFVFLFLILSVLSLLDKFIIFNSVNFIIGSILYITIYIYENYYLLKFEKINFFQSNDYLLISIPILFFLGMSFMFAFNSHKLTTTRIYGDIKLYTFINYFVNIIYYSLINLYIYKERKQQKLND